MPWKKANMNAVLLNLPTMRDMYVSRNGNCALGHQGPISEDTKYLTGTIRTEDPCEIREFKGLFGGKHATAPCKTLYKSRDAADKGKAHTLLQASRIRLPLVDNSYY